MKPTSSLAHCVRLISACVVLVALALPVSAEDQQPTPPRGGAPTPPRPASPRRGGAPPAAPKPAAPKPAAPAEAKKVEPPPPADVRMRTVYTSGDQKTDTVTYVKGLRKRYEFKDMVLLDQRDLKKMVQISPSAKTFLEIPSDGALQPLPVAVSTVPPIPPKPPGVVMVTTTIADTTERKMIFGRQARRVRTVMDMQPMPGACDTTKKHVETDGWYIDAPPALAAHDAPKPPAQPQATAGCVDTVQATLNGDGKMLGYPVYYTTTLVGPDAKPVVASMELTELELTTLDPALFEVPPGFASAATSLDLSKALSDANEAKLAAADAVPPNPAASPVKVPGQVRVGVPEFTNGTGLAVDTRALRDNLVAELARAKIEAVPMAAAPQADLPRRAGELGYDYLLLADVAELKVSKPGRLGGVMRAASGAAARGGAAGAVAAAGAAGAAMPPQDVTEANLSIKLLQPDGKSKMSTSVKGKDGGGFSLQTGLGLARLAGGIYLNMMMGPQLFARLNGYGAGNLGGVGLLGDPALFRMQTGGLSGVTAGVGVDATAGAASYLMHQALTMSQTRSFVGMPGQGPSYDESLGEAVQNTTKAVQKALQSK